MLGGDSGADLSCWLPKGFEDPKGPWMSPRCRTCFILITVQPGTCDFLIKKERQVHLYIEFLSFFLEPFVIITEKLHWQLHAWSIQQFYTSTVF